MKKTVYLLIILSLLWGKTGLAQIRGNTQSTTVYIGGLLGDEAGRSSGGRRVVSDGVTGGIRLGLTLAPSLAVEATLAGASNDVDGVNTGEFLAQGNIILYLRPGLVVPFTTAGIGFMHFFDPKSETNFAFNFGGGFQIFLHKELSLRFDIRNISTNLDNTNERVNLIELSGGLSFHTR